MQSKNNLKNFFESEKKNMQSVETGTADFSRILFSLEKKNTYIPVVSPYLKYSFVFSLASVSVFVFFFSYKMLDRNVNSGVVSVGSAPQTMEGYSGAGNVSVMNAKYQVAPSATPQPKIMTMEARSVAPVQPVAQPMMMEANIQMVAMEEPEEDNSFYAGIKRWLKYFASIFQTR